MTHVKKRLIFTLLYHEEQFMLSRNFRLQQVGNISWLEKNYNFRDTALSIDELIVLNVERTRTSTEAFHAHTRRLNDDCFVPIAAGGGIRTVDDARAMLRAGADKVVINSMLHDDPSMVDRLASEFGRQCLVASVDAKRVDGVLRPFVDNGSRSIDGSLAEYLDRIASQPIGELYLNSMDRDGTGQGFDLELLDHLPAALNVPLILAGGAGKPEHFVAALSDPRVDAVATAHLFNFVGSALHLSRQRLLDHGMHLARWNGDRLKALADSVH
jgi:cyclase